MGQRWGTDVGGMVSGVKRAGVMMASVMVMLVVTGGT